MKKIISDMCLYWVYLAGIAVLLIVMMTVINIAAFSLDKLARLFDTNVYGLSGYEDVIRLLISCIILMFFPWAQLQKGHVSIEFFTNLLSTHALAIIDKIWLSVTLIVVIFLVVLMYFGLLESYHDGALSRILGIIEWPFYIPGIISLLLWIVVIIYQLFFEQREAIKG